MKTFRASMFNLFKSEHAQSVSLEKVKCQVAKEASLDMNDDEVHAALDTMMEANQIMVSDNIVFLI